MLRKFYILLDLLVYLEPAVDPRDHANQILPKCINLLCLPCSATRFVRSTTVYLLLSPSLYTNPAISTF